jgi:hypothetical protein
MGLHLEVAVLLDFLLTINRNNLVFVSSLPLCEYKYTQPFLSVSHSNLLLSLISLLSISIEKKREKGEKNKLSFRCQLLHQS